MARNFFITLSVISIALMIMSQTHALASEKPRLAVLNFEANKVDRHLADSVRNMFEVELYKTGLFEMLERGKFDRILKEKGYKDYECDDLDCAVRIGGIISSDKLVIGSINRVSGIGIAIKYVDVNKSTIEFADMENSAGEDGIMDSIKKLTARLAEKIAKRVPENKAEPPAHEGGFSYYKYYSLSVIPGAGQLYAGHTAKGIFFLAGFLSISGYTGYSLLDFYKKRKAFENMKEGSRDDFNAKHKASGDALTRAKISLGILGGFYLIHWADIILFSRPSSGEVKSEKLAIEFPVRIDYTCSREAGPDIRFMFAVSRGF